MQPLTITRVGAFGDHILMSSTLPFLLAQHSGINLEVNMKGLDLFLNDPRFDYVSVFDVDSLNENERQAQCLNRWKKLQEDCDRDGRRFLNFWSSVENTCCLYEYNADVKLPREERALRYGGNFYEKTFEIAGLKMPHGWLHEDTLHFNEQEMGIVERWRERHKDSFVMVIALGGSSRQKVFIWMQDFCKRLIDDYPRLRIYLVGGAELAKDVWQYERTVSYVNGNSPIQISFKRAVLMTKFADYVLGGETGLLVGAGMMGTPKTMLFTLTKRDQLVNYHRNDYSLQSRADCSPCYVMAYDGSICDRETTYNAFPKCTTAFDLGEIRNIFDKLYCARF